MAACVGAILVRQGRILLGKRSGPGSYADAWDVPGGHVEPGEVWDTARGGGCGPARVGLADGGAAIVYAWGM